MFLLGTLEVFSNNTRSTLTPMVVPPEGLAVANARIQFGYITLNQFIGPPLGAFLFGVGRSVPFASQAVLVGFGALLVSRIVLPAREGVRDSHWMRDVAEGVSWTVRHPAVRTLVLTILIFNITYGAAWSVLVLYATRRLGLEPWGFGILNALIAVGGVVANLTYARITARISLGDLMRIGLVIETIVHLVLALTTSPWIAGATLFCFGFEAFAWGTTSITVRQRAVPTELLGRVNAVNSVGTFGGLVVGAAIGGLIAQQWGVAAPFWFAFVGSAVFLAVMWRQLSHIAHADPVTAGPH
jgi:predicted MFS family arabinose efflux permease